MKQGIIRAHPGVSMTWNDADAFSGECSDFVICRFNSMFVYHCMWEELKDSELFTTPYFHITRVLLGMENAFEAYDASIGIDVYDSLDCHTSLTAASQWRISHAVIASPKGLAI